MRRKSAGLGVLLCLTFGLSMPAYGGDASSSPLSRQLDVAADRFLEIEPAPAEGMMDRPAAPPKLRSEPEKVHGAEALLILLSNFEG